MDDTISRQAAIDALKQAYWDSDLQSAKNDPCVIDAMTDWAIRQVKALPTIQPDEKLEKCRFEYINACRTANCPTPDTTRKDRRDAYAVIKVLQPIFGDVPFAKVKRGEAE